MVVDLTFKAASLKFSLPEGMLAGLAELVRSMNCYYSNLLAATCANRTRDTGRHRRPEGVEAGNKKHAGLWRVVQGQGQDSVVPTRMAAVEMERVPLFRDPEPPSCLRSLDDGRDDFADASGEGMEGIVPEVGVALRCLGLAVPKRSAD